MEITNAHGAGGKIMEDFIKEFVLGSFESSSLGSVNLEDLDDGASITLENYEVVVTSDSHTVKPLFFPGGDIGKLAACGTINDLAVMGAKPIALSCNLVIEEGFSSNKLGKILDSMNRVVRQNNAFVICGDTKVIEKGRVDKLIVATTGIGIAPKNKVLADSCVKPGDKIIVSGTVGDHGIALLSYREGFTTDLISDVGSVLPVISKAVEAGGVHAAKDPTRGGLANALNEWAEKAGVDLVIEEDRIPIREEVKALSELLGIDALTVACEGRDILAVSQEKAEDVLSEIRKLPQGRNAEIIGEATEENLKRVIMKTEVGGKRILERPLADPVPRIC